MPGQKMNKKLIFGGLIFFTAAIFIFSHGPEAQALEVGQRGIAPANPQGSSGPAASWFIYDLKPGESKEDAAIISNHSDELLKFQVYAVDAETTSDGAFAPLAKNFQHKDVGSWVKMSQDTVEVPAGQEVTIPFVVTVPKEGVDVGEHFGAIVMEEIREKPAYGGGTGVEIVTRVGVRMYVTIPGEIKRQLEIKDFRHLLVSRLNFQTEIIPFDRVLSFLGLKPAVRYTIVFKNSGNVRAEPIGQLKIKNIFGRTIYTTEQKGMGMVIPGKETMIPVDWTNPPFIGRFTTTVDVTYAGGSPISRTISFWIIPYPLLILLAIIIVLIILFRLFFQLIVAKEKSKMQVHVVAEGETIESIAANYRVRWKLLVRVNRLKAPYQVTIGQQLLIPRENLWLSFVKSFFGSRKNILIILAVIVVIGGAIGYWQWHKKEADKKRVQAAQEKQKADDERLNIVLSERTRVDDKRKEDLKAIQAAVERYYQTEGHYPISPERSRTIDEKNIFQTELVDKGHLTTVLVDPKHPDYYYGYISDAEGKMYELTSVLENRSDPEGVRVDDFVFYRLRSGENKEPAAANQNSNGQ
ncbi:MAG: DUF916 domain-containing protein [Patescibacteria group bacterium]|nr:DUF916 domain-containing protein [Patescibacteria group bacterium]